MHAIDQFHVGIVVDDISAMMNDLTAMFGYEWCEPIEAPGTVVFPAGDRTVKQHLVFSRSEPRLELIKTVPGTIWVPTVGSGVHHVGYWSDDVMGDARILEQRGFVREAAGRDTEGQIYWTYHRADWDLASN